MSKKIKMRKWFVFSLLFTFLLTISFANVKAITEDDITNLNNTTWTFNNTIDSGWYGTLDNILFEDVPDGNVFNAIEVGENADTGIMYIWFTLSGTNDTIEVYNLDDGWISSTPYTITFKSNITDSAFVSFIKNNATYIDPDPVVTHDIYFSNYDQTQPITASDSVYYQINEDDVWRPIVDSNNTLPRWVNGVSSIRFKNETLNEDLVIYNYDSVLWVVMPGITTASYTVDDSLDLKFLLEASDTPITPEPTYTIKGGYRFNSTINWNYSGNPIDTFSINFTLTNSNKAYQYISLSNTTPATSTYILFSYDELMPETGVVGTFDDNAYVSTGGGGTSFTAINSSFRYLNFDEQTVSSDIYNFLISNGEFGNFVNPDPEVNNTWLSEFLLDSLNGFLQFELVPGFSLFSLLALCVSIPLLIYILKLFLGG